jgi:hypothetical protein
MGYLSVLHFVSYFISILIKLIRNFQHFAKGDQMNAY